MINKTPQPNVSELAHRFDCITEDEFAALAGVKLTTLTAWRKRGQGPDYILLGCTYLYPCESLSTHLAKLVRKQGVLAAKDLL